ncbi:hypothetical protein G7Y79_00029g063020 [Physcia stellaris]|nr:hypothetical protein G7Y79_00029g063020 [Physcia stellaris]
MVLRSSRLLQDHLTRDLDALCNRILQKFDTTKQKEEQERLQQQQAEQARIAKEKAEAFACRRCPAKFPSNTKLHQHVQDHHQKKPAKPASEIAMPSSNESTKSTPSESAVTTPPATPPSINPYKLCNTKETNILGRNSLTPSHCTEAFASPSPYTKTSTKYRGDRTNNVPAYSAAYPPGPVPKHQHQKPYLTIDDLFEMFAEKRTISGPLHTRKTKSFPKVSHQSKITSYFRPTTNQGPSISQGSKTPNPRSFQQHTPAESNRTKSRPPAQNVSEKSAVLPCKSSTFSRLPSSEISSISPYKSANISRCKSTICPPPSSTPRAPSGISASPHACRICSGTFGSNNGLHRHLRAIHFDQATRRHRRWII